MTELLNIYLLPSDIRTCFFYRSKIDSFNDNFDEVLGFQIKYGPNFEFTAFGSLSSQVLSYVPVKSLGVTKLLAANLKLKENDQVLFSYIKVRSIKSLEISPKKKEDYVILLSCKGFIESNLLNQVRIVSKGQILPLYIFSNIIVDIKVENFDPGVEAGCLEKLTEVTVLDKTNSSLDDVISSSNNEYTPPNLNKNFYYDNFIRNLNCMIGSTIEPLIQQNSTKFYHRPENKKLTLNKYLIWPNLLLPTDVPKKILDKFIFVSDLSDINEKNCFGPCSKKIFCEIIYEKPKRDEGNSTVYNTENESHMENSKNQNLKENPAKQNKANKLYSYVVSFNCANSFKTKKRIAFCPVYLMRKLNIFVGSKIQINKVKKESIQEVSGTFADKQTLDDTMKHFLLTDLKEIKENIIANLKNNLKFNFKLNTLIIGSCGTGKSSLINALNKHCSNEFIFTKSINCKCLRGKKLEALLKILQEIFIACCRNQPAILFMDDLHALIQFDDSEEKFNQFYSDRVITMISAYIKCFQEKYNVSVIATSTGLKELGALVTVRGPRLFSHIERIPNLNATNRFYALNDIIKHKFKNFDKEEFDISKIANVTHGYTIQDLCDLVDKSLIKFLVSGKPRFGQQDFDLALSEYEPLNLRGITNRKKIKNIQWDEIEGMKDTKKILLEVFSWPLKYPDLLESCPLKIQKGVLLYGAPGTGKTLLAGALAKKCGLNFIGIKGPEILSKYVGASEENVRNLFIEAQKKQPCLLFFDEFDSLARKRGYESTGVTDRVVNQLLTQLDGVESVKGVGVLAATSRPDLIDPALLRPGRLDKIIFCDFPNKADRLSILNVLSKNMTRSEDFNLEEVAEMSEGYTAADLQAILTTAQILAVKDKKDDALNNIGTVVRHENLIKALHDTRPSISQSEKLRYGEIYEKFTNSRLKNSTATSTNVIQKVILV